MQQMPAKSSGPVARTVVGGGLLTVLSGAVLALLGSQDFVGTFNAFEAPRSCGSVLHISTDLNAMSCQGDLQARVTFVSLSLGLLVLFAFGTPLAAVASDRGKWSPAIRRAAFGVGGVAIIVAVASFFVWQHLIWQYTGG